MWVGLESSWEVIALVGVVVISSCCIYEEDASPQQGLQVPSSVSCIPFWKKWCQSISRMWSIPARGFCGGQVQALTNTRWLDKVRLVTSQMNTNIARLTTRKPLLRILTPHRGAGYWSRTRWRGVNWVEPLEEFGCYEHHTCLFRAGCLDFKDPSNCPLESVGCNRQTDLGVYYGRYWVRALCTS